MTQQLQLLAPMLNETRPIFSMTEMDERLMASTLAKARTPVARGGRTAARAIKLAKTRDKHDGRARRRRRDADEDDEDSDFVASEDGDDDEEEEPEEGDDDEDAPSSRGKSKTPAAAHQATAAPAAPTSSTTTIGSASSTNGDDTVTPVKVRRPRRAPPRPTQLVQFTAVSHVRTLKVRLTLSSISSPHRHRR
jgi:hypothetical protein